MVELRKPVFVFNNPAGREETILLRPCSPESEIVTPSSPLKPLNYAAQQAVAAVHLQQEVELIEHCCVHTSVFPPISPAPAMSRSSSSIIPAGFSTSPAKLSFHFLMMLSLILGSPFSGLRLTAVC
jgi:hypothetical protein